MMQYIIEYDKIGIFGNGDGLNLYDGLRVSNLHWLCKFNGYMIAVFIT